MHENNVGEIISFMNYSIRNLKCFLKWHKKNYRVMWWLLHSRCNQHASSMMDLLVSTATLMAHKLTLTHKVTLHPFMHHLLHAGSFCSTLVMMSASIHIKRVSCTSSSQLAIIAFVRHFMNTVTTKSTPHWQVPIKKNCSNRWVLRYQWELTLTFPFGFCVL